MFHFQLVLFLGNVLYGIIGRETDTELSDDLPCVTDGCDPMNGHTRLSFSRSLHCLVHVVNHGDRLLTQAWVMNLSP